LQLVLAGILVGSGKLQMDTKKRVQVGTLAAPKTCQGLRKIVHYLLWLCKLAPKVASNLQVCCKYTANESKDDLKKVAGEDYDKIVNTIKSVCSDLNNAEPVNAIDDNSTLVVVTDSSLEYRAATLTQVYMDTDEIAQWSDHQWAEFRDQCNNNVIGHYSKANNATDQSKGAGFCELQGMLSGLDHFDTLIYGRKVLLVNDNRPAIAALTNITPTKQVWRMLYKWNRFYNIIPVWVEGKHNLGHVDAASRLHHEGHNGKDDLAYPLRDPGPILMPDLTTNRSNVAAVSTRSSSTIANSNVAPGGAKAVIRLDRGHINPAESKTSRYNKATVHTEDEDEYAEDHLLNGELPNPNDDQIVVPDKVRTKPWVPEFNSNGTIKPPRSSETLLNDYEDGTLFVPEDRYIQEILEATHNFSAHYGQNQMLNHLIRLGFWVPNFRDAADAYKARCLACMRYDVSKKRYNEVGPDTWRQARTMQVVAMDTATLPTDSAGNNTISVIVDTVSGMVNVKACTDKSSESIIDHLKDHIAHFGHPLKICADGSYNNATFNRFCEEQGIKVSISTPYYPMGNGIAEDAVKHTLHLTRKLSSDDPTSWSSHLWLVMLTVNDNLRTRIGNTPFYTVFHRHPGRPEHEQVADQPTDDGLDDIQRRASQVTPIEMEAMMMRLDKYSVKREHRFSRRLTKVLQPGQWVNMINPDSFAPKTEPKTTGPYEIACVIPGRRIILYNNEKPRGILINEHGHAIICHTVHLRVAPPPTHFEEVDHRSYPAMKVGKSAFVGTPSTGTNSANVDWSVDEVTQIKTINGIRKAKVSWTPSWVPTADIDPIVLDKYNRKMNSQKKKMPPSSDDDI
jgi:hypothetical protein